jgi:hypothetical protein
VPGRTQRPQVCRAGRLAPPSLGLPRSGWCSFSCSPMKMTVGLIVCAPSRVCGLVLVVPFRFASFTIDFESGQGVLFREVPSVIERTGAAESLVMSACAGDCGRNGRLLLSLRFAIQTGPCDILLADQKTGELDIVDVASCRSDNLIDDLCTPLSRLPSVCQPRLYLLGSQST